LKHIKVASAPLNNGYLSLLAVSFLLPFSLCIWQFVDADFGRSLLSPLPFSDASLYHYSAWYKSVFFSESYVSEIIVFSPYERLLTGLFKLFGHTTITPFVFNAVLSGLTCMALVTITLQLFSLRSAWVALGIYCFTTPILFFSGVTLKSSLVLFLTIAAILMAILFFKRRNNYFALAFCVLILVASIDRVHVLVGLVIYFIFLCWPCADRNHTRQYRRTALVLLLFISVAYGASSVRYGAEPKYVSSVGLNIYIGHSAPDNFLLKVPGIRNHIIGHRVDSKRLAERNAQRTLSQAEFSQAEFSQAEVTQYWLSKTTDYIKHNPTAYLRGQGQKLHHLFAAQSNSSVSERAYLWRGERWPLRFTFIDFALIFALFSVAVVVLFRQASISRQQGFLLAFCLLYLLSVMTTIVTERYRLIGLVCMIPMAAWAVIYLCENIKRGWRLFVLGFVVFASSQFLAYTAPAQYQAQFDKHLSLEKRAHNGRYSEFQAAKQKLESDPSYESCMEFKRQLSRNKFSFDLRRTQQGCMMLRKN